MNLETLDKSLSELAAQSRAMPLSAFGQLSQSAPPLTAAAVATGGPYTRNCDNTGIIPFRCGGEPGLALAVCTGNYKDMGCAVATGAAIHTLAACLRQPLLSEADIAPALRHAAIEAHDAINRFQHEPLGRYAFGTCMGTRSDLRGIGSSMTVVAAIAGKLFGAHIGEGKAYLVRGGAAKKLTLEHTLANTSAYKSGEIPEGIGAELIVLHVLGLLPQLPELDVFRVELLPGDRIIVGNLALQDGMLRDIPGAEMSAEHWTQHLLAAIKHARQWCPAAVGCITHA